MALKDTWKDLQDAVQGVPDSGDDASAEPINDIAHAVIDLEDNINRKEDKNNKVDKDTFITGVENSITFTEKKQEKQI